jgi:hypothetical protein
MNSSKFQVISLILGFFMASQVLAAATADLECSEISLTDNDNVESCLILPEADMMLVKKLVIKETNSSDNKFESMIIQADLTDGVNIEELVLGDRDSALRNVAAQTIGLEISPAMVINQKLSEIDFIQRHHYNSLIFINGVVISRK